MFFNCNEIEKDCTENSHKLVCWMIKIRNHIFAAFYEIFGEKCNNKLKYKQQVTYEILVNLVMTLQLISIVWYPHLDISDWNAYQKIWDIIRIASYDNVCAWYGLMDFCYYSTLSLIGILSTSIIIIAFLFYFEKNLPNIIVPFLKKLADLISTVCLIPSSIILVAIFKYSIIDSTSIDEWEISDAKNLDFGRLGVFLSIYCLFSLVIIISFYEIFTSDIRHTSYLKNIKARSFGTLDLQRRLFSVGMCASYVWFGRKHAIYHQTICFFFSFLLCVRMTRILQYFNFIENAIQICKMGSISLVLLIFIFGELFDNSLMVFIFSLILQPIFLFFLMKFSLKCYKTPFSKFPGNQFDFERKYRYLLANPNLDDKYQILNLFAKYSKIAPFKKCKLFMLWEFNFCISIINDERLARIKLIKIVSCENSFEGDIQEWRVYNWLKNKKGAEYPEIVYLEYLQELVKIKRKDENLCYLIIQLQSEFASRAPRMQSLINLSIKTSKKVNSIGEGYKMAIEKHKSSEIFELYNGFLENILSNHKEANLIEKKKNGMDLSLIKNSYKNLEYEDNIGIMLISGIENTFGMIVYSNKKASEILKSPINDICGNSIFNLFPYIYGDKHKKLMRNYIHCSESVEVPCHRSLFFQNQHGFLIECSLMIKLTSFKNNSYFLLSFQRLPTTRQIALISEDGIILNHSELFSDYVGYSSKFIKNTHISHTIKGEIQDFKENEPIIVKSNDKEVALLFIKKAIKSQVINILLAINDESEIKKIRENQQNNSFVWNSEIRETISTDCSPATISIQENREENLRASIFDKDTPESLFSEHEDQHLLLSKPFSDTQTYKQSSSKSSNFYIVISQKLILDSKKKIRIVQWVLFLVTLTLIIIMIAIMANIVNDVNLTSSMVIFHNLGSLLYNIGLSADSARTIDKSIGFVLDYSSQKESFLNVMEEIRDLQKNILSDFKGWEFCSASDITTNPLVPFWSFEEQLPKIAFENIYNTIDNFLFHISSMIQQLNKTRSYKPHTDFLVLNGLGQTYDFFNQTILELESCAVNQVKSIGSMINSLLLSGFYILAVLVVLILFTIWRAVKKIDEFWNFFINNSQIALRKWKCEAVDRLVLVHHTEYYEDSWSGNIINIKRKVRTRIELKFFWRIFIFIIISVSYYFILYFYLYPECENYMINRPKLLNDFNIRRSLVSRVGIFSRDVYSPYFINKFILSYGLANSSYLMNLNAKILQDKNKELREEKFMKMMSKELQQKIFERSNLTAPLLNFGTEAAVDVSIYDTINISYQDYVPPIEILRYVAVLQEIQNDIDIEFGLADNDSYEIINSQLKIIIVTTAVYSFILCGLFFTYYLPLLSYQIKELNWIAALLEILVIGAD